MFPIERHESPLHIDSNAVFRPEPDYLARAEVGRSWFLERHQQIVHRCQNCCHPDTNLQDVFRACIERMK